MCKINNIVDLLCDVRYALEADKHENSR